MSETIYAMRTHEDKDPFSPKINSYVRENDEQYKENNAASTKNNNRKSITMKKQKLFLIIFNRIKKILYRN